MNSLKSLLFSIIIISQLKLSFEIHISYPFKKKKNPKKSDLYNLIENNLEIILEIGTPPQKMNLRLQSRLYQFFIISSQIKSDIIKFNETLSSSFQRLSEKEMGMRVSGMKKGYLIEESLKINNNQINNISLMLATEIDNIESGALGLRLIKDPEKGFIGSFIYQIKTLCNLDNYGFYLNFFDDDNGEIIIGTYPHLINKTYNEKNFIYKNTGMKDNTLFWIIDFDILRYDNEIIKDALNFKGFIDVEFGLISAPYKMQFYFKDNYLNITSCKSELISNYYIYNCDLNYKIENLKNLSFQIKGINYSFNLTYQDLFFKNNNKYVFVIVFTNNEEIKDWIMGEKFLRKYQLIFDLDKKIIGFYTPQNDSSTPFIIIFLLISFILITILLLIYIFFRLKKPRKIRANELLDDNYDYIPS